ncbi:MAG TPA: hypothetical protein VFO01_02500 [Trebonia sp.]|nr:hypothetical protein [Trebonia sp.]
MPGIPLAVPPESQNQSQSPATGNAASLFPALAPEPATASTPSLVQKAGTRPLANTSALPQGAPIVGAQVAGLAALALALILAVTRLSVRRRPAAKRGPETAGEPGNQQDGTGGEGNQDAGEQEAAEAAPQAPPSDGEPDGE